MKTETRVEYAIDYGDEIEEQGSLEDAERQMTYDAEWVASNGDPEGLYANRKLVKRFVQVVVGEWKPA